VDGIEVDASLPLGAWTLSSGYSFADAQVRSSGAAASLAGLRPAQTPRHTASAAIAWRSEAGARASLSARYTGAQYEDDLNEQILADALTFEAAASLPIGKRLAAELRAENLTDERVVAGISGAGIVERATPRTIWIGLRLRP
jgi:outer membrane receptor protein involved in Fe transport